MHLSLVDKIKRWIKVAWLSVSERVLALWVMIRSAVDKLERDDLVDLVVYLVFPMFFLEVAGGAHWGIVVPVSIFFCGTKAVLIIAERQLHESEIDLATINGKLAGMREMHDIFNRAVVEEDDGAN